MKTIPTMLEPSISLDLKHLRECNVRGCTICDELRRRGEPRVVLYASPKGGTQGFFFPELVGDG